jgi:acyl dehydratase
LPDRCAIRRVPAGGDILDPDGDNITAAKVAGGFVGVGLDECRWSRPVRPGDELRVECEVLDGRPSKSRPEQGLIKLRTTTLNQDDEPCWCMS